jgi:hypothetical protein
LQNRATCSCGGTVDGSLETTSQIEMEPAPARPTFTYAILGLNKHTVSEVRHRCVPLSAAIGRCLQSQHEMPKEHFKVYLGVPVDFSSTTPTPKLGQVRNFAGSSIQVMVVTVGAINRGT